MSDLSSGEGVIWAVRDAIYKAVRKKGKGNHTDVTEEVLADPGIEDKRLFGSRAADPKAQKILDSLRQAPRGLSRTEINARVFNRVCTRHRSSQPISPT